jgi:hypothetical protein
MAISRFTDPNFSMKIINGRVVEISTPNHKESMLVTRFLDNTAFENEGGVSSFSNCLVMVGATLYWSDGTILSAIGGEAGVAVWGGLTGDLTDQMDLASYVTAALDEAKDYADAQDASATHAATDKTTPVDADELPLADSAATFGLKKLSWANFKATLKVYFDTLYLPKGVINSSTFALKPAASAYTGFHRMTDVGYNSAGSMWFSDGVTWRPCAGAIPHLMAGISMGLPPSGTMGNNGAVTFGTGLGLTYSDGAFMYYPTNAIFAGSAQGMYWTVMSNGTVGTVYNNTYTGGQPIATASPTAFVTTGPGAFTQTTGSDITLASCTLRGNSLGSNGFVSMEYIGSHNNTAGNKLPIVKFGGTSITGTAVTFSLSTRGSPRVQNCGNSSIQRISSAASGASLVPQAGGSGIQNSQLAINTTADVTIAFAANIAVATDLFFYNYINVLVTPS